MTIESEQNEVWDYDMTERFVGSLIGAISSFKGTEHESKYGSGRSHEDIWIWDKFVLKVYFQFAYDGEYYITDAKLSSFIEDKEKMFFHFTGVYGSNHTKMNISFPEKFGKGI